MKIVYKFEKINRASIASMARNPLEPVKSSCSWSRFFFLEKLKLAPGSWILVIKIYEIIRNLFRESMKIYRNLTEHHRHSIENQWKSKENQRNPKTEKPVGANCVPRAIFNKVSNKVTMCLWSPDFSRNVEPNVDSRI